MIAELTRSLSLPRGTALLLNIVIGAGLLTLPGLAVRDVGPYSFAAWIVCSAAALPLLVVFIVLGRRNPDAGGVSAYAQRAFGPLGQRAASLLFLGAVSFGLPAIALSGGHYLAATCGGSPHVYGIALLVGASIPHFLPGTVAARLLGWLASLVLLVVTAFLTMGLFGTIGRPPHLPLLIPELRGLSIVFKPFMMLFFAFTGWEVGAGIAEEFHNPERDYPLAMMLSFAIATFLYLAIAFVALRVDLTGTYESPFIAILRPSLGNAGAIAVAAVAVLIIFANLAGAVWGVSRQVFGLARDGVLPVWLAHTADGRPLGAVVATILVLLAVLILDWVGWLGMEKMLGLAGQNFLILYALAAMVMIKNSQSRTETALGLLIVVGSVALLASQGLALLYPLALICLAAVLTFGPHLRTPAFFLHRR